MRVELPYRCWQVPSSFSSGRRCKSFQRPTRQSKHWLQMEGRVTIFPLSLFSRRVLRLSFSHPPSFFLSLSSRAALSMLLYFFSLCFCRPTFVSSSFKRGHVQPRLDIFRIRGWHTFTIVFLFFFPKGAQSPRGRVGNDLDDNFISSYYQHVPTIRLSAIYIEDVFPCFTRCRGSILISVS